MVEPLVTKVERIRDETPAAAQRFAEIPVLVFYRCS